jgi:hypothetical protein
MSVLNNRRGSALITVMLMICLMMIAIAGVLGRTSAERRNAMDGAAQVDAFALAADGIDKYLAAVTAIPAALPDSQTFTLPGGRAVVTLRRMRSAATDTTLLVISRGENTSGNSYSATSSTATRTLTQFVKWSGGSIQLPAGFTSLSGFNKNGVSGSLSGVDACAVAPAPLPSIPGIAVPSISALNPAPDYTGPTGPIDGNPDNTPVAIGTPGVGGTAKDSVNIDWAGIKARTAITPTYYDKTSAPTSGSFPTSAQISGTHWPVTFVEGNISLPSDGQGILIVTGDLTINGSTQWAGIVLVGGNLTSNGNNNVQGAIMTGLNVITGTAVPQEDPGNGNKLFQYNSCDVANSLKPFGSWTRLGNAKTDNFPIY